MTPPAAALATAEPVLRNAAGEPPLGIGGLAFRDDQGEVFRPHASYVAAGWIGVLELETGQWLAQPPGFRIDAERFASREIALRTAIALMILKARRFTRAPEGDEGTHWTQGYGGRVIEWALSLKEDKGRHPVQVASADAEADRDHPVSAIVAAKYKISVQFSGGAASYVAAKLILEEHGHDDVALIFADTLIEDEDLYRFLDDAERHLQHPIIRISEGRDPWTVFFDERMMGNSLVDPCSKILKRKLMDKWRAENCIGDCTLVIGYDASEDFRFQPLKSRMLPVKVRAPLLEQGVWKEQVYAMVEADGLRLPRLYGMGFSHNNCGGFCVKAGQASFALLLENLPERYAQHEAKEEEFRKFIGKDVSIMRDRRGGVSKPLTMREFRERHEREPMLIDRSDVGGCLCMEEPDPLAEDDDDRVIAGSASATGGGLNPENPSEEINPAANNANGLTAESPSEEITPEFTSWRYDRDDAVQLDSDPIVAQLLEAHRLRQQFPAKHAVSMTTAMVNGEFRNVGTCACGVVMSHTHPDRLDAAIEAHWRRFVHEKDTVDGRGQLIKHGDASRIPSAKPKRKKKSEPAAGGPPAATSPAKPEGRSGVASAPSANDTPGADASILRAPEPAPTRLRQEASPGQVGAALSDDDWLLKAAAELAWRDDDAMVIAAPKNGHSDYLGFLNSKVRDIEACGFEVAPDALNPALKSFQRDIVVWALKRGRAALFAGTGLGKTLQQLVWADEISRRHGRVLILTPLAVAQQTVAEALKFNIEGVAYARSADEISSRIVVTNYERLEKFDPSAFAGVVLDESSILKAFDGKTRTLLTETFANTKFKLCCTATPAPNDYTELGNHAEFLGILLHKEMLATWFVHEGSSRATNIENYGQRQGSDWRLKGHAHEDFWRWLASWSVMIRHPRDLGYEDAGYDLPPLHRHQILITTANPEGLLGPKLARTLQERQSARRDTIGDRVRQAAAIVNAAPDRQWLVWCNLNDESTALAAAIDGAVEVRGSDDPDLKAQRLLAFAAGELRVLVSKPSIAGWGMNFQRCADMVFVGLNDSFEQLYQAIRRCWRFGQTREVNVHLIAADVEGEVVANLEAKEAQADYMAEAMVGHMRGLTVNNLRSQRTISVHDKPMRLPEWLKCA